MDKSPEVMAEELSDLLGGNKPDIAIECSGVESSIRYSVLYTVYSR
jgi:threonine dehydrogenase-like Zn-dependent dehydrogenase